MTVLIMIERTLFPFQSPVIRLPLTLILLTPRVGVWSRYEVIAAVTGVSVGGLFAFLAYKFVYRYPWPRPFRPGVLLLHIVAAPVFAFGWYATSRTLAALLAGMPLSDAYRFMDEGMVAGTFVYLLVAGISNAAEASARASRAESVTARTQLAALRAQVQPHFLFNALHAVVQLIPKEPARASEAAELVAGLLRTTLEEKRDEVPLADEWKFVSGYLAVERIRFGERLIVRGAIPQNLLQEFVPSFAVQTLVENAVQHGAAPSVAATQIVISATSSASELKVSVWNSNGGAGAGASKAGAGTGLSRLRERLGVLYGSGAKLDCNPDKDGGFEATLVVPRNRAQEV